MRTVLLALALLASAPSFALDIPKGSAGDARVKVVDYDEGDVVAIYAFEGVATHIVFGQGEEVQAIASGFSGGWEAVNRGNHLYLKPKSLEAKAEDGTAGVLKPVPGRWDTNLAVTTNKRVYSFQLFLVGPRSPNAKLPADDRVAFRVTFRYPDEVRAAELAKREQDVAARRLANPPMPRNADYTLKASRKARSIMPSAVYDDGRFTYFAFPANQDMPAVYLIDAAGERSLVNTHVEDGALVVQRVAPRLALQLGKLEVLVTNNAYDAVGSSVESGTTAPNVRRTIEQGAVQ